MQIQDLCQEESGSDDEDYISALECAKQLKAKYKDYKAENEQLQSSVKLSKEELTSTNKQFQDTTTPT